MTETVPASRGARNSASTTPARIALRAYLQALRAVARWCVLAATLYNRRAIAPVEAALIAALSLDELAPWRDLQVSALSIADELVRWMDAATRGEHGRIRDARVIAPEWSAASEAIARAVDFCTIAREDTSGATRVYRYLVFSDDGISAAGEHRTKLHEVKVRATRAMQRASGTHAEVYCDGVMVARRVRGATRWEVSK